MFVLDCSIALAWCFLDECDIETDRLLDRAAASGIVVPAIWDAEIGNALAVAERRGRISLSDALAFLRSVEALRPQRDHEADAGKLYAAARGSGLTAYDAAYLELALRLGRPLASRD